MILTGHAEPGICKWDQYNFVYNLSADALIRTHTRTQRALATRSHARAHAHAHAHSRACVRAHRAEPSAARTHAHARARARARMSAHARARTHECADARTPRTASRARSYASTHMRAHARAHTHAYTVTPPPPPPCPPLLPPPPQADGRGPMRDDVGNPHAARPRLDGLPPGRTNAHSGFNASACIGSVPLGSVLLDAGSVRVPPVPARCRRFPDRFRSMPARLGPASSSARCWPGSVSVYFNHH